jgi:hypothetical protein
VAEESVLISDVPSFELALCCEHGEPPAIEPLSARTIRSKYALGGLLATASGAELMDNSRGGIRARAL